MLLWLNRVQMLDSVRVKVPAGLPGTERMLVRASG